LAAPEYERICAEINHEKKLETFLYLVPNCELHAFLLHALRNSRRRIVVTLAAEFVQSPHTTLLIDARTRVQCRLEDCLTGAIP